MTSLNNSNDTALLIQRAFVTIVVSLVWLAWRRDLFHFFHFLSLNSFSNPQQFLNTFREAKTIPFLSPSHAGQDRAASTDILGEVTDVSRFAVAEGGFAAIYRGVLRKSDKNIIVAIKVLRGERGREEKFFREASIWKTLEHRNILSYHGTFFIKSVGAFGMVCPWIEKGDLTHYLKANPRILLPDRLYILNQIAAGVQYLHSCSIIHGDLTGNNILVEDSGNILICDFGLSKIHRNNSPQFHSMSTVKFNAPWAAPEVIFSYNYPGSPMAMKSSDVYSFGSVMLQVLTGSRPYLGKTWAQVVIYLGIDGNFHPPRPIGVEFVSDELWDFMLQCWARTPSERPLIEVICAFFSNFHYF